MLPTDSITELLFPSAIAAIRSSRPSEIESAVMGMFEQYRDPILRYALSFGISVQDAEDVTQEVFLSLFRHLQLGRSRKNLRGWIFRVAHNLALKLRYANRRSLDRMESSETIIELQHDMEPNPEEHLLSAQRWRRLRAFVQALPEIDKSCLQLRAEGLRYREIAAVLGISLGAVSISLARSLARLVRGEER